MLQGIVVDKVDSALQAKLTQIDEADLPEGDVLLRVDYSTINFKDALALTGSAAVVRRTPMVPGIDGAGVVEQSRSPLWKVGDKVVLNGWGVGEVHWGCLAQKARVRGEWLVPLPAQFSAKQAMAIGTAGYTAMLCLLALKAHRVLPKSGEILVTGAAGGVGSVAIALLAKDGYNVVASTGRMNEADYLKSLGAKEVIDRAQFSAPGKPLGKERWAGAIDSVGSHTLANVCATTRYGGVVAACGLAQGLDLPASVAPFILRGITLCGIESSMVPRERRLLAWQRLAADLDRAKLDSMTSEIALAQAIALAPQVLAGKVRGRTVVNVNT